VNKWTVSLSICQCINPKGRCFFCLVIKATTTTTTTTTTLSNTRILSFLCATAIEPFFFEKRKMEREKEKEKAQAFRFFFFRVFFFVVDMKSKHTCMHHEID